MSKPKPGSRWRILAHGKKGSVDIESVGYAERGQRPASLALSCDPTIFDELVVSPWLHLEQMGTREWCLDLGGYRLAVYVGKDGVIEVTHDGQLLSAYGLVAERAAARPGTGPRLSARPRRRTGRRRTPEAAAPERSCLGGWRSLRHVRVGRLVVGWEVWE